MHICDASLCQQPNVVWQTRMVAVCRWATGVLIFELVAGFPPFYHDDRVTMFKNICQVKYTCPPHFSKVPLALLPGPHSVRYCVLSWEAHWHMCCVHVDLRQAAV